MKKIKMVIKERSVRFPTLPIIGVRLPLNFTFRLPSLEGLSFGRSAKAVVALTMVMSVAVISGAVYFAIKGIDPAPTWPQSASYNAALAQQLGQDRIGIGQKIPDDTVQGTMTLELNIGGARIESLKFSDMSIGKASGLTDAINISASSGVIICEKLELIDVEATDFLLATSTAYSLTVATTTADGMSISPTLSSDPIKYAFGSNRGALNVPAVNKGTFDRILISSNATSTVGTISFERVKAYGAGITITDINCGEVVIMGTSQETSIWGDGTGIDSPSFTISNTLKMQQTTMTGNVEKPVSVK